MNSNPLRIRPFAALLLAAACATCTPPDAPRADRLGRAYLRVLAAEDTRPASGSDLVTLREAAASGPVFLRQVAVRALGRLENPELVEDLGALLDDPAVPVRAEAANALAQVVHGGDGDLVVDRLIARAEVETDSLVLASLARSIGRSAASPTTRARAVRTLIEISHVFPDPEPLSTMTGVALGFESLVRGSQGQGLSGEAAARLIEMTRYGIAGLLRDDATPVRRLAYVALGQARRLDATLLGRALDDPNAQVRMLAAQYVEGVPPGQRPELLRRVLGDRSIVAPIEAVRATAREPRTELYCRFLLAAAAPTTLPPIRLPAIDALARPCPQSIEQRVALDGYVAEIADAGEHEWHAPAHALISLAQMETDAASTHLPAFVTHANPFVRSYAARAAGLLEDTTTLRTLVADSAPNVRTAAIPALFALEGHAIDDVLIAQLADDDPQLLMTASGLLEGSPAAADAADALLTAFERVSEAKRDTWRDSRRALLGRIAELGDASMTAGLTPYLTDYDAVVAADVAAILTRWDGRARATDPEPLPPMPLPTPAEYAAMHGAQVVLHMTGGPVVIDLMPESATTNVFRFLRLVESGYFDGLTFHRWAVNFVLQGGSPGANEYQGDGPYSRDEVGLQSHWRGTVGISTRGRDTGDGQIFVNLVDNVRLNHDYTIIGSVVEGMDVIDLALEGAVIERAGVVRGN